MRALRRHFAILVAIPLALAGCAGSSGVMRPEDTIRIVPLFQGRPAVGAKTPNDVPNLVMVSYVCGPLAIFCLPVLAGAQLAVVANQPVVAEAPANEVDALRKAIVALHERENVQDLFVASLAEEASGRWKVSPNAASSLTASLRYVGLRPGSDGQPLLELIAYTTLKAGTDPTGFTANVGFVRPFARSDWREDPAAFSEEMRAACRDLAREVVRKYSR